MGFRYIYSRTYSTCTYIYIPTYNMIVVLSSIRVKVDTYSNVYIYFRFLFVSNNIQVYVYILLWRVYGLKCITSRTIFFFKGSILPSVLVPIYIDLAFYIIYWHTRNVAVSNVQHIQYVPIDSRFAIYSFEQVFCVMRSLPQWVKTAEIVCIAIYA